MNHKEKLTAIREQMLQNKVQAYIIPSSDPHISEYLPEHFLCLAFASGFTGSAGTLVITETVAGLWTDGRYFVQAEAELKDSGFQLMPLKVQGSPEYIAYLAEQLPKGSTVAFDGRLLHVDLAKQLKADLERFEFSIQSNQDYLSSVWTNRPALVNNPAFFLGESITGEGTQSKLTRLRAELKKMEVDYQLISSMDDIAWLLNVRGSDVDCNPLVLSHLIVSQQEVQWFINGKQIGAGDKGLQKTGGILLKPYDGFEAAIKALPTGKTVLLDPKKFCQAYYEAIPKGMSIVQAMSPTTGFKAVKNKVEQEHIRQTMILDGRAMVKFLKWLEENAGKSGVDELSAIEKLSGFRAEQKGYVGNSFGTISAYGPHAALPHYHSTPQSNSALKAEGIYLVDSGGQYQTGTTDITRVVSLGNITEEQKKDYTLVLKGMIDLSMLRFPEGTKGYQIDAFSRQFLWKEGYNFNHGTGHGVGFFLNVHEGPQVINGQGANNTAIVPGMLTSNEPGIYRPGKHGIRIENLVICQEDIETEFGKFLRFETVTLCPISLDLVNVDLLTGEQRAWLNNYHEEVYEKLSPGLSTEENAWLKGKTKAPELLTAVC